MAELNSSVVPTASNTWSSLGLLSPVKVLENPVKNILLPKLKSFFFYLDVLSRLPIFIDLFGGTES